ncbi:AN1-type zinc finger protein 4 isoform X1 [Ochotona princeps]|uniref:AN1-type zinc finger protein 4 isoform X1 n=1 Tax=Ochotona princeps TaxID=9978 RepID=UPI0027147F2E|nr:AN1-type zinc finger protein 4 isoform X1 [Ochotona princeps]XP_058527820.1 AN1-type zinc finger protein 4 isoform X1 [Ochotona princeps]XP_058527821.1 AN1-type zinc finger protein 4 isoform X1 [Ochotona princeps]
MVKADWARTGVQLSTTYSRGIRKVRIMDNEKEPPFFNEDHVGPFYYKLPFYDTMELFIETLTGTCFELRVSPCEAVISVKAKIQRLEGIPICQQHLIWNNLELEDDYCLNDYNISEGCTLKLVLAMRGGPINTRRVPMEDPLWERAANMDTSGDEVWEKTCNKQVTFLVYQEGDQLNFFRVVDRGDGTLTPLSESLSSGSAYNVYTDEDEETEPSPSGQQIIENSITMNKMKLLKAKMEDMNLSKKPKKVAKIKPRPPIAPRPSSGPTTAARHRLLRVLPHIGQSCLPSGNTNAPDVSGEGIASLGPQPPAESALPSIAREGKWESTSPPAHASSNVKLPPQLPHFEFEKDEELAESVLRLGSALPRRTKHLPSNSEDDPVLFPTSKEWLTEDSLLPEVEALDSLAQGNAEGTSRGREGAEKGSSEFLLTNVGKGLKATEQCLKQATRVLSGESADTGVLNRELSPPKGRLLSPLRCPAPVSLHDALGKPQRLVKCFEPGNLQSPASQSVLRSLEPRNTTDTFCRTTRFRAVKVDSPGKRPDIISKVEARGITEMANKASREPVGSVNNIGFLASLARSASRDSLQSTCGAGRHRAPAAGLPATLPHFQEESLRRNSPQLEPTEYFLSTRAIGMNGNNAAAGKRVGEGSHHLPPVKAPMQTKKKTTTHCFLCGKKTGLATSYECRCGNNFCASHRYAEAHSCTYDYKSAGRRYLQEKNPVVNAPKLPKI